MPEPDSQASVLRIYTALRLLRAQWGGSLIVSFGLAAEGSALAMAANIAGAVCLAIEEKPEIARAALRSGSCDFVVNTLDEALRAMKNEARKQVPISIGLEGSNSALLTALVDRGVQPEMLTCFAEECDWTASEQLLMGQLQLQGAMMVTFSSSWSLPGAVDANSLLDAFLSERTWKLHSLPAISAVALRELDANALSLLDNADDIRRQWLRSASRIVQGRRPLHRVLWLTEVEKQAMADRSRTE